MKYEFSIKGLWCKLEYFRSNVEISILHFKKQIQKDQLRLQNIQRHLSIAVKTLSQNVTRKKKVESHHDHQIPKPIWHREAAKSKTRIF